MRRADRLFQITQILRGRRNTTARLLAERLQVAERTIYRDIRDLSLSGVPIEGEAGVGYRLSASFDLPPLMFTRAELETIVAGLRLARSWGSAAMAQHATTAEEKIAAAMPGEKRIVMQRTQMYAPAVANPLLRANLDILHASCSEQIKIQLIYSDLSDQSSERIIHPLGLFYWGGVWTLLAWCELRTDFRSFRVDRMQSIVSTATHFTGQPGQRLEDYLRRIEHEDCFNH